MKSAGENEERSRALVVDDDEEVRFPLCQILQDFGLDVRAAEDGASALGLFDAFRPDIVLLDVMMPNMDGFRCCALLRTKPRGDQVPILMMTSLEDVDSIHEAYRVGATDFITKPINYALLQYRIQFLIRAKKNLDDLWSSERRLAKAQRIAHLGYWELDPTKGWLRMSEEALSIFGLPRGEYGGSLHSVLDAVHPEDREEVARRLKEFQESGTPFRIEHRIVFPDGTERVVCQEAEVLDDGAQGVRFIGTAQDITEYKRAQEQIYYLAYYDALTGLPNSRFLRQHLAYVLGQAKRYHRLVAVLSLDLDFFKRVNDSLGHSVGDVLLRSVARRLTGSVQADDPPLSPLHRPNPLIREGDTVARFSGDQFMVLLPEIRQAEDAGIVARRIRDALAQPFELGGKEVTVTVSIGISVYPDNGEDEEELLKNADAAMHHAKDRGRSNYQFFAESVNARALERFALESDLRRAVERGELFLHYQPMVDLRTGGVVGAEALVRWQHPKEGLLLPGRFISLAEETGIIVPISEWVLHTAIAQRKAWQAAGMPAIRVSVNVSARHFREPGLVQNIRLFLRETGLEPQQVEVEITEGVLMEDTAITGSVLGEMKAMGLSVSLDDFGTGYSSLSYLKRFPIDTVKIDREFVRDITNDATNAALVNAIIAMTRSLGMRTVAEGVETSEELAFLQQHGCQEAQGFFISRPMPAETFTTWLGNHEQKASFRSSIRSA